MAIVTVLDPVVLLLHQPLIEANHYFIIWFSFHSRNNGLVCSSRSTTCSSSAVMFASLQTLLVFSHMPNHFLEEKVNAREF